MKKSLLYGALLAAAPLALVIQGCGGGGGTGLAPSPTPTPAPTATPVPNSQTSNFTLSTRQMVTLTTTTSASNEISGAIQVLAPVPIAGARSAQTRSSQALSSPLRAGTFTVSGTFSAPRGYNITARLGSTVIFTLKGLFPTATETGTFTLTTPNGQTESGILPKLGDVSPTATPSATATPGATATPRATATPAPTATPRATPAPTTAPGANALNLTISQVSGANVNAAPVNKVDFYLNGDAPAFNSGDYSFNLQQGGPSYDAGSAAKPSRRIYFHVKHTGALKKFDSFIVGNSSAPLEVFFSQSDSSFKAWQATSGAATITAISANSITLSLDGVKMQKASFNSAATGTFTLSGTASAIVGASKLG